MPYSIDFYIQNIFRSIVTKKIYFDTFNNADISRDSVATFHFDDIADDYLFGGDGVLLTASDDSGVLGNQVFERFHDSRRLGLLIVGETSGYDDHSRQHYSQV